MLHVLQYSILSSVQLYCNVIYSTVTGDGMALRDVVAQEAGGWLMVGPTETQENVVNKVEIKDSSFKGNFKIGKSKISRHCPTTTKYCSLNV